MIKIVKSNNWYLRYLFPVFQIIKYKFNLDRKSSVIRYVKGHQPKSILEIGVHNGDFAARMLKNISIKNQPSTAYFGIDLFSEMQTSEIHFSEVSLWPDKFVNVQNKLENSFPKAKINLLQGFSVDMLKTLKGMKFDLIFIDGGHSKQTVESDWNLSKNLLGTNGAVFFDDYTSKIGALKSGFGIKSVVDQIDNNLWVVKIYTNKDFFIKKWGVLSLRIAKITRKHV